MRFSVKAISKYFYNVDAGLTISKKRSTDLLQMVLVFFVKQIKPLFQIYNLQYLKVFEMKIFHNLGL